MRHGTERLIDSPAEGVIDKDEFTSRMNRRKTRIAGIDAKIGAHAVDEDRRAQVRSVMRRLAELSSHLQFPLCEAGWATKREIIRAFVQRLEIAPTKVAVVLRLPMETSARAGADYDDIVPSVKPPRMIDSAQRATSRPRRRIPATASRAGRAAFR